MNSLFTEITASVGLNSCLLLDNKNLPYNLSQITIKPNDILNRDNFNFSLSCLYTNFLEIASRSYFYNPKIPITNPFLGSSNNIVCTLCGTYVPFNATSTDFSSFYVNGIPHSKNNYTTIYNTNDFTVNDGHLTIALGILSATSVDFNNTTYSSVLSCYKNALGIVSYPLSAIYSSIPPYSAGFGVQGVLDSSVQPRYSIISDKLFERTSLKFNNITKVKFFGSKLYVLDNENNSFLEYDTTDLLKNRIQPLFSNIPSRKINFSLSNKNINEKITTFCINSNYIVFYNYIRDSISVFSSSFKKLFDLYNPDITENSSSTLNFADMDFDSNQNLNILTKQGKIFVYTIGTDGIKLKNTHQLKQSYISYNSNSITTNDKEEFLKILFSKSDKKVFYVSTKNNIYKKFVSSLDSIGQINTNVLNTVFYSTLSSSLDPFNQIASVPTSATSLSAYTKNSFVNFTIKSINSLNYNNEEIFSVDFVDNSVYNDVSSSVTGIAPVRTYGHYLSAFGFNPVSGSGISFLVDKPNFVNLNNEELDKIKVYDFNSIQVNSEEFQTDFSINKSLRKLLYNIFNYQTYVCFKPVVDIDINNNPVLKSINYIVPYLKDQDFTNFDNFVGINEINSTVFLNRCFSKVYNLLETIRHNISPEKLNLYPRVQDSIQLLTSPNNYAILFEDSKTFIEGDLVKHNYPLNENLCIPVPTPTPSLTPKPTSTSGTNFPTPTPTPTPTINVTPTPTISVTPTPTPEVTSVVKKLIKHTVEISLDNSQESPIPQAPFSSNTKSLTALYNYDNTTYTTLKSPFIATFDHTTFNQDLTSVGGDYTKLVGKKYGDYTFTLYTTAYNTDYKKGGFE